MIDTGTGKTLICLESCFRMFNEGTLDKVLIVCTKSSVLSFTSDIEKTNYKKENLIVIKSNKDLELINKAANKLFVIQYETLLSIRLANLIKAFKGFSSGLFIDEVHKVKTVGKSKGKKGGESYTAAALETIKKGFVLLVGLTATTMTSKLEDSYRVINFIKPKTLGGYNWFCDNFCIIKEQQRYNKKLRRFITFPKIVAYKNLDKFLNYTKDMMIQFFPKLDYRFKILSKSMKPDSARALKYDELAKSTHGRNKDNHSAVMPKLQRLIDKSAAKKTLLKKVVNECREEGLIIYTQTRKSSMVEYIKNLVEKEGLEVRTITGSTKANERKEIIDWGFAGEANKAVIITDAGGQSLNLQFTHNLVFWEVPVGIGKFLQVKGRIGRMFSKWDYYNFYFLLVKNTIDEYRYLKFTSNKEILGHTSDDVAIPISKMNSFNERKIKKTRDSLVWRKDHNQVEGKSPINIPKGTKRLNK